MCVVGIAVVAGPVGVIAFYLATMLLHGVANPLYRTILHEHADDARRTSVLSVASMAGLPGGAIGGIVLGALATATSVTVAMLAGAAMLALAVPMYLPARASNVAQDPSRVPEVA
jgi:sugar phosphate permease